MKTTFSRALLMLLLFCSCYCLAQNKISEKFLSPLHIGEKMPDIEITGISNYYKSNLRFSELRNKLIILDFWMGACKGCILGFPKMEALQNKFKDRIQIIMVNFESQKKIDSTFGRWSRVSPLFRNPALPSVTSDQVLHQLFSFQYYPHEVWIDESGKVIAFTSLDEVNEKNIAAVLDHRPAKMDMKMDFISFNDYKYPLFSQVYPVYPGKLKFYTVLMGFIPGVSGGTYRSITDSASGTVRLVRKNKSVLQLFADALLKGLDEDPYTSYRFDFGKRVLLQTADSGRYVFLADKNTDKTKWEEENCYSYESVMPIEQKKNMYDYMFDQLKKTFNLDCRIEKRNLQCYALVRTSDNDKFKSTTGAVSLFDEKHDTSRLQIRGGKMSYLVEAVSRANKNTPLLFADDSGYSGAIDVEITKRSLTSIVELNKALEPYDLKFIKKVLPLEVFVLKSGN